jgi:hypothetical protein
VLFAPGNPSRRGREEIPHRGGIGLFPRKPAYQDLGWDASRGKLVRAMFQSVSKPHEPHATYRCPCCRFKTLHGRGGFELCPICFWEDDGQDDQGADEIRGDPNGSLSLPEARINYSRYKASDSKFVSKVRPPLPEEN